MRSILIFTSVAALTVGCGLSSSIIPGVNDNETPGFDGGPPVADAGSDAHTYVHPVQDAATDAPLTTVKDAEPDAPIATDAEPDAPVGTVIQDAAPDAPIFARTLPDGSNGEDSGEEPDSGVVVPPPVKDAGVPVPPPVADSGSPLVDAGIPPLTDSGKPAEDAGTPVDDGGSTPVADAAPACYTKCDDDCISCKLVCTGMVNCDESDKETCTIQCTTVQTNCHTVCDTHGCGGY